MTFAVIAGTIGIVLVTVGIGVVVDRRVGVLPRGDELAAVNRSKPITRRVALPGDTAATAVRAYGEQLAKLRASQKCPVCKTSLAASSDGERVRFGGADLLLLHFACATCPRVRTLYVDDRA